MDIVLCTDNNYLMPCGVTMISVMENNRDLPIKFHIVGVDLTERFKEQILSITTKYENVSISFYEVNKELFNSHHLTVLNLSYISVAAYTRLFLADILPSNIDKILYLDCDIIVLKSLSELWNTNIEKYSIAGIQDVFNYKPHIFEALGYERSFGYINSGVLLINLKYWREHNLVNTFLSFYKERKSKFSYHDQDVINGTLYDSKLFLHTKYNVIHLYYFYKEIEYFEYENEIIEAMQDPTIIHYTGSDKPWFKACRHPMKNEFLKYKKISIWKDIPLAWRIPSFSKKLQYYKRIVLYDILKLKKGEYVKVTKDTETGKYKIK